MVIKMILRCSCINRLAYPYNFGVRLTICWAILRPYDCCQFPYDSVFPVRHFIAVPYIIDRISISGY